MLTADISAAFPPVLPATFLSDSASISHWEKAKGTSVHWDRACCWLEMGTAKGTGRDWGALGSSWGEQPPVRAAAGRGSTTQMPYP